MSAIHETVAGIAAERADQDRRYSPRTDKRPSPKQIYRMARELCDIAGIDWPETSADASALISRLAEQTAAVRATAGNDGMPF